MKQTNPFAEWDAQIAMELEALKREIEEDARETERILGPMPDLDIPGLEIDFLDLFDGEQMSPPCAGASRPSEEIRS